MPQKPERQRQANDDLLIMTHDGDMYLDDHVRQEMGLLLSDRNQWAMPIAKPAGFYEFHHPFQQPGKVKSAFVYRSDPPSPGSLDDTGMIMNRVLRAVHSLADRGQWKKYQPFTQQVNQWKFIICALTTLFFFFMVHNVWQANQEALLHAREVEEARQLLEGQPTGTGPLTDKQIEELLRRGIPRGSANENPNAP